MAKMKRDLEEASIQQVNYSMNKFYNVANFELLNLLCSFNWLNLTISRQILRDQINIFFIYNSQAQYVS